MDLGGERLDCNSDKSAQKNTLHHFGRDKTKVCRMTPDEILFRRHYNRSLTFRTNKPVDEPFIL